MNYEYGDHESGSCATVDVFNSPGLERWLHLLGNDLIFLFVKIVQIHIMLSDMSPSLKGLTSHMRLIL